MENYKWYFYGISRTAQRYYNSHMTEDLTAQEAHALRVISIHQTLNQQLLADRLGIDKSQVTRLVNRLEERGYAILKDETLVGYLEGDSARGLELLAGRPAADVLEIQLPGQKLTARITRAATVSRFASQDGGLTLSCRVWAQLAEYRQLPGEEEREYVQQEIARQEETKVRLALARLTAWKTDCLGLGPQAGILSPGQWSVLSEDWPRHFGEQTPQINLTVELTR